MSAFKDTDKKRLYWLIDQYLSNNINTWDFCSRYHDCCDVHLDLNSLSEQEDHAFSDLSLVAGRFSPYEEDHAAQPGFFSTEEQVRAKAAEIKTLLKNVWPNFE